MPDQIALPRYFPVSSSLVVPLENLRGSAASVEELKETQRHILKAANTYFELLFPDDSNNRNKVESTDVALIKQLLEAYEKLTKAHCQTNHLNTKFAEAKTEMIRRTNTVESELTSNNIDAYIQLGDTKKSFSQILEQSLEKTPDFQVASNNKDYKFLKNATFVLDHPLDQLPDEDADDEIEMGGGKIDLRCPVSMNIFINPMISEKCGHTFDLLSIQNTWVNSHVSEDCPIPGCSARLRRSDFVPDRLMKLRVKSYKAQQEKFEDAQEYERLD